MIGHMDNRIIEKISIEYVWIINKTNQYGKQK